MKHYLLYGDCETKQKIKICTFVKISGFYFDMICYNRDINCDRSPAIKKIRFRFIPRNSRLQ